MPEISLQFVSVCLQATITSLFAGSLWFAWRNLKLFNHTHQASLLKALVEDYRRLVERDVFDQYHGELEEWQKKLLNSNLAPAMVYNTKLSNLAQIGQFYDHVGILLRQGLLDFHLCFEVIPVPYKFWEDTKDFRAIMKEVTYAEFWDSFEYLVRRYESEREARKRPLSVSQALRRAGFR